MHRLQCCEPVCPWEAIFDEHDVPNELQEDIALNAITAERPKDFHVPVTRLSKKPSYLEVEENRVKWTEPQRTAT